MDDGQVIPGLNEDYTFGGAKVMEWIAGITAGLLCHETLLKGDGRAMPIVMLVVVLSTFGLAALRKRFPDEERGVRNSFMVHLGLPPPGIPVPAALCARWSGAPIRAGLLPESMQKREFYQLGLDQMLSYQEPAGRGTRSVPLQGSSETAVSREAEEQ